MSRRRALGVLCVGLCGAAEGLQNELGAAKSIVQAVRAEIIRQPGIGLVPLFFRARCRGELDVYRLH